MMELTVLGCHGPYAPANGACSGYLVNIDGFYIMLDCGNGTFSRLQKHMDYTKLGVLVVSHLHPDHYSDIYCLRQALKYAMQEGLRQDPLFVYLPEGPVHLIEEFRQWDDVFMIANLEEVQAVENNFNLFSLHFFKVQHSKPAYGVRISVSGKVVLTYTSDTGWYPELVQQCQGSKFLLAEASLKEYELGKQGQDHLTAKQAGTLAQSCGAEQLILTHFFPAYNTSQMQRQAEQSFDGRIYLAAAGKKYILQEESEGKGV